MRLTLIVLAMLLLAGCAQTAPEPTPIEQPVEAPYNPKLNPDHFSSDITNKYFTFTPGTTFIYEAATEDGTERIEVTVLEETKDVAGIETRIVWDRVWLNGDLIEDTKDWYAQDREGNVWYFGEDTHELANGIITSNHGAWTAGIDGALPGIVMKASPKVGETYRQEYYKDNAEDMADVLSIDASVTIGSKTYSDCLQTYDYTPLDKSSREHKYYCPEVGGIVLEVGLKDGERAELIEIKTETKPITVQEPEKTLKVQITEEQAQVIALKEVSGKVTDIAIEDRQGKTVYVVEVDANYGPETDVIVDADTGEVLGVEK